jgi:hypothetical protein
MPLPLMPLPQTPLLLTPLSLTLPACLYTASLCHRLPLRPWPAFFIFIPPVSSLLSSLLSIPVQAEHLSFALFVIGFLLSKN